MLLWQVETGIPSTFDHACASFAVEHVEDSSCFYVLGEYLRVSSGRIPCMFRFVDLFVHFLRCGNLVGDKHARFVNTTLLSSTAKWAFYVRPRSVVTQTSFHV